MDKKRQHSKLVGKIILADFLEYPLPKFINFIQAVEGLSLYKKLTHEGIIIRRSLLGAKVLKKEEKGISIPLGDGIIAKIKKDINFNFSIYYTKEEFSIEYVVDNEKLTGEEKRNINELLHKLRRISTRNLITHGILNGIVEYQRDYFESNTENEMDLKLKPLQMVKLARTISNSDPPVPKPGTQTGCKESSLIHSFVIDTSRISRVTQRISIITPQGRIVALKELFPTKRDIVKKHINVILIKEKKEIYNERIKRPYTDEELKCKLNDDYNLSVTRREISYCRNDMGILPYSKRLNSYGYPPLSANFTKIYPFTIPSVKNNAPTHPGVYELRLADDMIEYPKGCCQTFYIGSSKNLRKRLLDHLSSSSKNGGIKKLLKKKKCVFRYIKVTKKWVREEKNLYNHFITTFGDSPICNHVSPKAGGEGES
jgi:RNA polymerase sigma-54 factor